MQWDATRNGGFTTGRPWLPPIDPERRNVEAERENPASLLELYRRLIALRRELAGDFQLLEAVPEVVSFRRGPHVVAVNTGPGEVPAPRGEIVLATHDAEGLPPGANRRQAHAPPVDDGSCGLGADGAGQLFVEQQPRRPAARPRGTAAGPRAPRRKPSSTTTWRSWSRRT